MLNHIRPPLIGGTLTLVLIGLRGLSVVVGVDATMHGWAIAECNHREVCFSGIFTKQGSPLY